MVRDRLARADWSTKREITCLLVKRIEVAKDVVRVVFRVDPSSPALSEARQSLPHCPTRRRDACHVAQQHARPGLARLAG
jgi:site-specific DNA recombinase